MQPQIYSGSRVTVSIGGNPVAAGFVADFSIDTAAQPLDTIDSVFPLELMPSRISVFLSIRVYRHPDNDPILDGIAPGGAGVGTDEQVSFLRSPYIYIEIKDNFDKTILTVPRAFLVRRTGAISVGDLMTENWSIQGIGYYGPSDV